MSDTLNIFGSFLKKIRKKRKITQEQLASALNVSTVSVHQLETAKVDAPSKEKCLIIASTLGVDSDLVWNAAKEQKLLRFLKKENITNNLKEPITYSEKLLLDLLVISTETSIVFFLNSKIDGREKKNKIITKLLTAVKYKLL